VYVREREREGKRKKKPISFNVYMNSVGDAFNPKNFRLCYEVGEIKKNIIKKYLD
jgi:hypothetical protein